MIIALLLAATLNWNVPVVTGYKVHYGTVSGSPTTHIDIGNKTTYTIPNLPIGTYYFTVTSYGTNGAESLPSNQVVHVVSTAPTPTPVPTPTPTPTPTPVPTPTPPAGINITPATVQFSGIVGGPRPAPITVRVTTSNGSVWTSQDTCAFFDAIPTTGTSGSTHTLTPSAGWDSLTVGTRTCPITYSASGLQNKVVDVIGTKNAAATPTPVPTPVPTPTPDLPVGIHVRPTTAQLVGIYGGARPAPIAVVITTVNGEPWTSSETCAYFDASPISGPSGSVQTLTATDGWDDIGPGTTICPIVYKAEGLQDRSVGVMASFLSQ